MIAVELPGHTTVVNTTVCQTWCQTCGEVVVSCFPFCKLPCLLQLYFFCWSAKHLRALSHHEDHLDVNN